MVTGLCLPLIAALSLCFDHEVFTSRSEPGVFNLVAITRQS
ncbi:hypothetical protein ABZ847_22550 [Streptomyces bauhiniae]